MSPFDQAILAAVILYVLVTPYLAAWLALRICARNWGCVARRQGTLDQWHAQLERERPTT